MMRLEKETPLKPGETSRYLSWKLKCRIASARSQTPVLTAEGYALLKYNAEYLIDRLPERNGTEHEENREDKR